MLQQLYLSSVTGAGDVLVGQVHLRPAGALSHMWLVGGRRSSDCFLRQLVVVFFHGLANVARNIVSAREEK